MIEAVWFNRSDLKDRFKANQEILLSGKVSLYRTRQFVNPLFEVIEPGGEFAFEHAVIPVYPLTAGLSLWAVRRVVKSALEQCGAEVGESLTREQLRHYDFPPAQAALRSLHLPGSLAEAEAAHRRLVYEELFYLQLLLALRRRQAAAATKVRRQAGNGRLTQKFRAGLPFSLTRGQEKVLAEILGDMAADRCMNRLLQGDVGSGKTVVALLAMLVSAESDCQAALMAPTEILAEQHFGNWHERLDAIGARSALLTGSTRAAERRETLAGLASGAVRMVFGTHALIEGDVQFRRLGLVVVDEQHRFGVMQRANLLGKGRNPDFLVMTATPIPRTLAMTLYGDLDTSVLAEKPPGRKPVDTRLIPEARRREVYDAVGRRLATGEQAFVVCPIIDESEKVDLASAIRVYEETRAAFPDRRVGLVHGRLKSDERSRLMAEFKAGELDIVVATSVIEVGVDVPNATLMVIEHPERFGLAQLHQLRGRIGRSPKQSYCILIVPEAAAEAAERLRFFALTTDGFELAEKDMELRGPGELLGTRQHGLPDLRAADLVRDRDVLKQARRDAFRAIELDPGLAGPQNEPIRRTIATKFKDRAELLRVG
jgi:ATP-dependent DNA helicase RecG